MKQSLFLSHPCLLDHGVPGHPEYAGRLSAILTAIQESPYQKFLNLSCKRIATVDELSQVHHSPYIDYIQSLEGQNAILDADTLLTPGSVKAALTAAGLGIELVEQVVNGNISNGFALLRPPGHHARPGSGMGFCTFNNIAIAAQKALSLGLKRILIVDWDVHHGNGTQESFYADDRVFLMDLHQDNLFPADSGLLEQAGEGKGAGYTLNLPLPKYCGDADYFYAFDNLLKPLALEYQPELILVSAGFDAHEEDPLGSMRITSRGFGHLAKKFKTLADELCEGKMVLFLEGGYNPYFLAESVMECIKALTNEDYPDQNHTYASVSIEVKQLIQDAQELHVKSRRKIT